MLTLQALSTGGGAVLQLQLLWPLHLLLLRLGRRQLLWPLLQLRQLLWLLLPLSLLILVLRLLVAVDLARLRAFGAAFSAHAICAIMC